MRKNFSSAGIILSGMFLFFGAMTACKKDTETPPPQLQSDTVYVLTSIRKNNVLLDSMVYDTIKQRLQSIITPTDTPGLSFSMSFVYNSDNKVIAVQHYNTQFVETIRDSVSYHNNGLAVTPIYGPGSYGDSTVYQLNADGQIVLIGSKDTVTADGSESLYYRELTLAAQNTLQNKEISYSSSVYGTSTYSYVSSPSYDTHPSPYYLLYRNYPALFSFWIAKLDFPLDGVNNPVTGNFTKNYNTMPTIQNNSAITYVYDSISHYPLQQSYTVQSYYYDEIRSSSYTINFGYLRYIVKK